MPSSHHWIFTLRQKSGSRWGTRAYRLGPDLFGNLAQSKPSMGADEVVEKAFLRQGAEARSVKALVNAFRRFGFLEADIDPLGLAKAERVPELDPEVYGFDADSLQKAVNEKGVATVAHIVEHLRSLYCGHIGVEFMHLANPRERRFLASIFEKTHENGPTAEERVEALKIMLRMKAWEKFVAQKFPTLKRYSAEGAESVAVLYRQLLQECPRNDINSFIWGGAHRGRLALQTVLFNFPVGQLFRKMRGKRELPAGVAGMGDVLTHQHSSFEYKLGGDQGPTVFVSTLPNPSHLEAALPMVVGKARARAQTLRVGDYDPEGEGVVGDKILAVHHHGDGAFTGQGVVCETLAMSQVPHFRIGGSFHVVVNNQLAFTADKHIGRSSTHCTDLAKAIDSPVLHVNAENIEQVIRAAKIAMDYRAQFRKDVFVNLVCYRRYGHNELDDPRFTQPELYRAIDAQPCLVDQFAHQLADEGMFTEEESIQWGNEFTDQLRAELERVDSDKTPPVVGHLKGPWTGFEQAPSAITRWNTGVDPDLLRFIGAKSVAVPDDFAVHSHLQKTHIDARMKRIAAGEIDWSAAEAMAIGSALLQGFDVRLSGQDVGRATFSHRHAMLVDQGSGRVHVPLNHIVDRQTHFLEIANSPLSEAAILAFEYGVSIENPRRLVLWEAQFGDFYNGAQVQIDTMVASGESKWLLQSGLVLLLPHGFDGAGPDHSSAHIERFLSLCDSRETQSPPDGDNVNMTVANPTTSAQYFHLLRRQVVTPFRRPLVLIAPKLLLRHSFTVSHISQFADGTTFLPVLVDPYIRDNDKIRKVVFCSGKHAVLLMDERNRRQLDDLAIVRLEGICPFPVEDLSKVFSENYPSAKVFAWSQEEPRNAGCWPFVQSRFRNAFGLPLKYVGRPEMAWMATPIAEIHRMEADQVTEETLSI